MVAEVRPDDPSDVRDHPGEWMFNDANEMRRIVSGPREGERPGGVGLVEFTVHTDASAIDLIEKSRAVLRATLAMTLENMRSSASWPAHLPAWFIEACAPEQSREESEAWLAWWRGLESSARARAASEKPWTLAEWLHWMEPDQRQWFWWDARTHGSSSASVFVEVPGWPSAMGALEWLLRAAGATLVEVVNPPS